MEPPKMGGKCKDFIVKDMKETTTKSIKPLCNQCLKKPTCTELCPYIERYVNRANPKNKLKLVFFHQLDEKTAAYLNRQLYGDTNVKYEQ